MDFFNPSLNENGTPILNSWRGTDAESKVTKLCRSVFKPDELEFLGRPAPKLDPSLFTPLSDNVALDLTGTANALGAHLDKIIDFLKVSIKKGATS